MADYSGYMHWQPLEGTLIPARNDLMKLLDKSFAELPKQPVKNWTNECVFSYTYSPTGT